MSWMAKLYETYEAALKLDLSDDAVRVVPICHTSQNAHIKVTIDGSGKFKRAEVLEKTQIALPATEDSAGRTSGKAPHPLADKIQYVAKDYADHGGQRAFFGDYHQLLSDWCDNGDAPEKVKAVRDYTARGDLVKDLAKAKILHLGTDGALLQRWDGSGEAPPIFRVLTKKGRTIDQGDALVCWDVEITGDPISETWKDPAVQCGWIEFDLRNSGAQGLCYITGNRGRIAINNPARIRHTGDKAKILSANDLSGFTFKGKFTDTKESIKEKGVQAAGVSYEVTQKAHSALRWLVSRQAFRNGDQVLVAWAVSCKEIPQLMQDTRDLLGLDFEEIHGQFGDGAGSNIDHTVDLGQSFSLALGKRMKGYAARLDSSDQIIIMGIDSATPGRMAITYYQEFVPDDYLARVELWHREFAWHQCVSKDGKVKWLVSAPAVHSIWDAIYGATISDPLKKSTVERVLPCIIEAKPFPADLVNLAVRRASNRNAYKSDEWRLWEKNLGIACALYKGYCKRRFNQEHSMALDTSNHSRDYLYGRLLAIAEHIEDRALDLADEKRSTAAARLMQVFADRPYSTWRNIELALQPYSQRLKAKRSGFLHNMNSLIDEVTCMFEAEAFTQDKPLSGEFLLGFHCQRLELRSSRDEEQQSNSTSTGEEQ